ncbi:MAG TPA: M20/M25/M40 family metallo-hydrolase, partial [Gemmatimonadaceae bacterium]|nr:M20/M25/M40 family metallo-hydrolase [Gemmatimonadaceae bacterium]
MTTTSVPDVLAIAMQLMATESTTGNEGRVIGVAERILIDMGWQVRRIPVTPGRDDLLAYGDKPVEVVLSTHLDTVPPYHPPQIDGDRLLGRGACDAKGIAAAMICAATSLRDQGVAAGVLLVVGEEAPHDGARAANAMRNACKVLINGEPTESKLAVGTKGALRCTITTHGKAAHSAYPDLGVSATAKLVALLGELPTLSLPSHPLLGDTTINIGMLSGGVADNVIAPDATARLMVRLVTPSAETIARLRHWLGDRGELRVETEVQPVLLGSVAGFETDVVAYATDVPELSNWGTPYLFGPGSIHVAHTDHEFIGIAELRAAVEAYERLAKAALA